MKKAILSLLLLVCSMISFAADGTYTIGYQNAKLTISGTTVTFDGLASGDYSTYAETAVTSTAGAQFSDFTTLIITNSTLSANDVTSIANHVQNSGSITGMTISGTTINGDVTITASTMKNVTLSNDAFVDANLTFNNCPHLVDVNLVNGTWAKTLTVTNCPELDHLDLKASVIGRTNAYWFSGKVDGEITIQNNAKLRYVILPHNYAKSDVCESEELTGNTSLHAVIATAYLSEYVYDENGNILKNKNYEDSTRFVTDEDGKYILTATYNIYKGGIPDDMMKIAQSMTYDQCTVHCRKPISGSGEKTAVELYDADNNYVKTLDFGIVMLSTQARDTQSESDMAGMNKFNTRVFDISRTVYDHPAEVYADNDFVNFIILPDNMDAVLSQSVANGEKYTTFLSRIDQCDNLIGAVSYCGDPDMGNANSDTISTVKGIMIGTKEPGHVAEILDIQYHKWTDIVTANKFFNPSNIYNVVLIGKMNAADITLNTSSIGLVNANGNYVGAGLASDNQATTSMAGFKNWNNTNGLTRIDLTRAVFPNNNDMRIGQLLAAGALKTLYLPISAEETNLPDSCLAFANTNMQDLCIPGNFKRIGVNAINPGNGTTFLHIFTSDVDSEGNGYPVRLEDAKYNAEYIIDEWAHKDDDRSAWTIDDWKKNGGAITISENVEFIGNHAFANQIYVKDVYAMGKKAPICSFNAFSSVCYTANNTGPSGISSVNRDSYLTGPGWMAMLHYPAECSAEEVKHYRDIDRKYTIPDLEGRTDGNGNPLYWPSQLDWNRSFAQACAGITWKYWKDAEDGSEWAPAWGTTSEPYSGVETYSNWQAEPWNGYTLLSNDYINGKYSNWIKDTNAIYVDGLSASTTHEDVTTTGYMGWHQFVLAETYSPELKTYDEYNQKDWYTICVPTDLTRAEVLKYFGVPAGAGYYELKDGVNDTANLITASSDIYPVLTTLYGVDRNMKTNKITLHFTDDLTNGKTWDFTADSYYAYDESTGKVDQDHYIEASGDNDVVMFAGCPYLIKPYVPKDLDTATVVKYSPAKFMLAYNHNDRVDSKGKGEYIKHPKADYVVNSVRTETDESKSIETVLNNDDQNYVYHFVGTYQKTTLPQYAYYIATSSKTKKVKWYRKTSSKTVNWNPYVGIIGALGTLEIGETTYNFGSGTTVTVPYVSYGDLENDDLFSKTSGAKVKASYDMQFGHTDESTTTGITTVETTITTDNDAAVYTLDGRRVNSNSLSKGIYIKNGKKFIVK